MALSTEVAEKLLPYQIAHTERCIKIFKTYGRVLDGSDTGTGKSYSLAALICELKLRALILTPKSVITGIQNAFKHFDIVPLGISNYESIQNCKYYQRLKNTRMTCHYIKKELVDEDDDGKSKKKKQK